MGQVGFAAGFAQNTTYGTVEVIVPWPAGGFALYWFDRGAGRWSGPWPCVPPSAGVVDSVSWHEGDYQSQDGEHNNFELVTVESGRTVHWFRDNGPPNRWTRARVGLGGDLADAASATLTRTRWAPVDGDSSPRHNLLLVTAPRTGGGMYQQHQLMTLHSTVYDWTGGPFEEIVRLYAVSADTEPVTGPFDGVGWVLGTVGTHETDFEDNYRGREMYVAVRGDGTLRAFEANQYPQDIGRGVRGRPAIIQSDRGRSDPWMGFGRHGNYELFAPSRTGGIRHFWRPNPGYAHEDNDWAEAGTVGTGFYDEVSVVQLRDEDKPEGDSSAPLWLFARCDGQPWVDLFQQRHIGDGFRWEQLPTLGDPARPQVRLTVEEDFVVVSPLKRGEVRRIRYTCFAGSPIIWLSSEPGVWVSYTGEALRAQMRASTVRTRGEAAAEEGLDTFERTGHLDTPLLTAGTVVRVWGTTDPSADPRVTPPPRAELAYVIATGRPGNLVDEGGVHAFPESDRVRVEVTNDARPVCLIAEIGEGAPAEHRPYGHTYHAFDTCAGRLVLGELRQAWQEDLVQAPGHELRPGATYTVIVRVMDTRGYWSETVAPVTLRQRRVDVTVDRVEIVASGDSGAADGWFSAEVYSGLVRQGVVERVRRWQFGDEDNWAELEAGDVFGTGGSLHAAGPPWTATIGPGPAAVRPFGVRLEIFDEDGLFEPDEHASGAWETEDDRPVVDAPFTVRTDREPSYATASASGRYTIAYVSPPGQPDRLDWRAARVDTSADLPAGADYDGDGVPDRGVWRPWPGAWVIEPSSGGLRVYDLGGPGDLPVPGPYAATPGAEPAVWRSGVLRTLAEPAGTPLADLTPHRVGVLAASLAALVAALRAEGRDASAAEAELALVEGAAYAAAALWLTRAQAAHPSDIPAQLAAAGNAWDVASRLAASPAVTPERLRILVAQLDLLARLLAFGSTDSSAGVRAATLARELYARIGGHELEIARSWSNQALTHHEVAFHPAQPHPQEELAAQREAAGHAADAYAVALRGPLDAAQRLAVARELDRVARLRVFGSADSAPMAPILQVGRAIYADLPGDHRADLGASYTSEALTHHEIAFHPQQQHAAEELAAQRAAARQAAERYFDLLPAALDTLPDGDVRAIAGNLRQLTGLLAFGLDDADTGPAASWARAAVGRAADLAAVLDGHLTPAG
ncbi:hypothetical protein AB0J72_31640 [Dactylosporangium sp. NPDC049742]|uniref:hypothetical protein n=1 Tax=Dactylosporangium sp. NPDC049742 TaxID=3154737 RepID=UPI0034416CD9